MRWAPPDSTSSSSARRCAEAWGVRARAARETENGACRAYRVVQWATGNIGRRALREVIRHPALELAGVLVYDPEKDGVDAGSSAARSASASPRRRTRP